MLIAGLVITGCGKKDTPPAPPPTPSANANPAPSQDGYLGTIVKAQQSAIKTIDVTSLNQEIMLFNAQEGRNPKDLDELVSTHYIGALPEAPVGMKIVYDAAQGKVSVQKKQ